MPQIQSVAVTPTSITLTLKSGTKTFLASDIPGSQDTPAKAEATANTWAAANITECQVRVHVFSLSPFRWTVGTFNLGAAIPPTWWASPFMP